MRRLILLTLYFTLCTFVLNAQDWTQKADFPVCNYEGSSFTIDGVIYHAFGEDCAAATESVAVYKYTPATDSWEQLSDFPGVGRRSAVAFAVDGKGYIGLGFANGSTLADVWQYDPLSDSWTQKNDFPGSTRGDSFARVVNKKAYVGGGISHAPPVYPVDLWEYNHEADSWTEKASFPPAVCMFDIHSFAINDMIYIQGVVDETLIPSNQFWSYNVSTDTWAQLANVPFGPRWYAASFAIGGKGYYGTGLPVGSVSYINDFYEFSPLTGVWQAITPIPTGAPILFDIDGMVIDDTAYIVAGSDDPGALDASYELWAMTPEDGGGTGGGDGGGTGGDGSGLSVDEEALELHEFAIYMAPNPATDRIEIESTIDSAFYIYNILGEKMTRIELKKDEKFQLDLSAWASGSYFIMSESHGKMSKQFFVY